MVQVSSRTELLDALKTAPTGATIDLAPGEYAGPILIDTPVTLRGMERQTVLWRRGGPVIFVRVPGVKLLKLSVERTVESEGPLVVHRVDCNPIGRESRTLDALINLGELLAGSPLTLPLTLETAGRLDISTAGLYGAQVTPSVIEEPGRHLVWLSLEGSALGKGEVLLGEITLREGSSARYLWLSGTVSEPPATAQPVCLMHKRTRLYPSSRGLLLGSLHIAALEGGPVREGQYTYIQQDPAGNLFLYLSDDPPAPVLHNGQPVPRWNRIMLHEKDTVQIDSVTFTVHSAEPPPVRIEPPVLTFADFDDQIPDPAVLKVINGKAAWKGRVIPVVSWLNVLPEGEFRLPASRSSEWKVALSSEALILPNGTHDVMGGLLVVGSGQAMTVDVRLVMRRPEVALQIPIIEAGVFEQRWAEPKMVDVTISNLGRGAWEGTLRALVPWVEVITPMPLRCEAWAETVAQIQIAPDWETLNIGPHTVTVLAVQTPEGDQPIELRLEITPSLPHLTLDTPLIAFDQVERNAPLPDVLLAVRNEGGTAWTGTIHAVNNWVRVRPAEFPDDAPIPPGESAEIEVHLLDIPETLALDTPALIDEIHIEGANGEVVTAAVQLTVVELPPYLVASPVYFPPFVRGESPQEAVLRVHNNGPARWRGTVKSNTPLLNVPDGTFTCEPGESITLYITVNARALDQLESGLSRLDDALSVEGGREAITATAYLDMREPISALHLDTPTLNFGQIDGAASPLPTQPLRLVNASPVTGRARIELGVPWLSIQGDSRAFDLDIHSNTVVEIPVALNELARNLPPGLAAADRAVRIIHDEQELVVRAMLVMNDWSPQLAITPQHCTLNGTGARQIMIRNNGSRACPLQINTVQWLNAAPTAFTLNPGQQETVEVKKNENTASGLSDPRALVVIAPGREFEVEVQVTESAPSEVTPTE